MNKNILKLLAVLMLCFALVSVLVACGGKDGADGTNGTNGKSPYVGDNGTLWYYDDAAGKYVDSGLKVKGENGKDLTDCTEHTWSEHVVELSKHQLINAETGEASIGVYLHTCTKCGDAYWYTVEHEYVAGTPVAPTCTEAGYTVYTCDCGHSYEDDEVEATGHTPAVKFPEGEFTAEDIPECWKATDNNDETTCPCITPVHYSTECVNGDCTELIDAWGNPGEHTWSDPQPSDNTSGIPACEWEKSWYKKCTVCSSKCSDDIACGNVVEVEELKEKPADHVWDDGVETTPAKCGVDGVKTFTCTLCNKATKTETITALEHDLEHTDAKAATCTEIGWDAYDTCKRDGCDYTTYNELEALGHAFTKEDGVTDLEEMVVTFTCNREGCDAVAHEVELPALTEENCGEGKFYTYKHEGTNCANWVHLYSFSIDLGEGKEAYTDTIRVEDFKEHEELTDEHTVRKVETDKYVYWMYECSECDTWVIFKHEAKPGDSEELV